MPWFAEKYLSDEDASAALEATVSEVYAVEKAAQESAHSAPMSASSPTSASIFSQSVQDDEEDAYADYPMISPRPLYTEGLPGESLPEEEQPSVRLRDASLLRAARTPAQVVRALSRICIVLLCFFKPSCVFFSLELVA